LSGLDDDENSTDQTEKGSDSDIRPLGKCKTPTLNELNEDNALKEILDTHYWKVVEAKVYGGGFEVRVQCSRCGLGRISLLYNLKESESIAKALGEDEFGITGR
jgi:hypothetical protein